MNDWFAVDKEGLKQLFPPKYILRELLANSFDEKGVKNVEVFVFYYKEDMLLQIQVEDDAPKGFADLTDAFTMFRPTKKQDDPKQRGRFNFGEKQVLAHCHSAEIVSTSGGVRFNSKGRETTDIKRKAGSRILLNLKVDEEMNFDEFMSLVKVPKGIKLTYNETVIEYVKPIKVTTNTLPTWVIKDGYKTTIRRKTKINVYKIPEGGQGWLFEMGIPVCEIEDNWDFDVQQKLPLGLDRDKVSEPFLRALRGAVSNVLVDLLTEDDLSEKIFSDALAAKTTDIETKEMLLRKKHGDFVLASSDSQANDSAKLRGYEVIGVAKFPKEARADVKKLIPTTLRMFPRGSGKPGKLVLHKTKGMLYVEQLTEMLGRRLIDRKVLVKFMKSGANLIAWYEKPAYGHRIMTYNVGQLHKDFFDDCISKIVDLIIHELAHEYSGTHLSRSYYDALSRMAGDTVKLALEEPELFIRT